LQQGKVFKAIGLKVRGSSRDPTIRGNNVGLSFFRSVNGPTGFTGGLRPTDTPRDDPISLGSLGLLYQLFISLQKKNLAFYKLTENNLAFYKLKEKQTSFL